MNESAEVPLKPQQQLKMIQLIHIALMSGVLIFAGIVFFLHISDSGNSSADPKAPAAIMTIVHLAMMCSTYPIGIWMFSRLISKENLKKVTSRAVEEKRDPIYALLATLQSAYIIRLALFEGTALFGLVVLMISKGAPLAAHPVHWVNLLSTVIMFAVILGAFPTQARLKQMLQEVSL